MLLGDSEATAKDKAEIFNDHRVCQFYDPDKLSGKAIAKSVGWEGMVAWDIYLFYPNGSVWSDFPPTPQYWMHQLEESWADRDRFHTGDDLANELFNAMKRLRVIKHISQFFCL
jgi:hypothetical protein